MSKFIKGETLTTDLTGYVVVGFGKCVLGFGKGAGGILKNHYPKGLRTL